MKKLLLITLILLAYTTTQAQDLNWAFDIGSETSTNDDDQSFAIARDATGNIYVTGKFELTADFNSDGGTTNNLTSNGGDDIFVAKYNSSGDYQWAFNIGGTGSERGHSVTVDASSNVYVTGYFNGSNVDFDPSTSTTNDLSSNGGTDIFVAKYNSSGDYQWAFNIGGTSNDQGYGIALDASSNVYVTGWFQGSTVDFDPSASINDISSNGSHDIYIAKYNSSGDYQWAFNLGGTATDVGNSVAVDASSNVYITGRFNSLNAEFDPSASTNELSSSGGNDIFVAKYNSSGDHQWAFNIGSTNADVGNSIAVDASSNVYVTGYFEGSSVDFDPSGSVNDLTSASRDIFIAKYNSSGDYQWAFKLGSTGFDDGDDIAVDASSNVYATGYFVGSNVDFDPSGFTNDLSSNGGRDIFVAKYNSNGDYQGAFNMGGTTNDYGRGIVADNTGQAYVTGYFSGTSVDFDPGAGTTNLGTSANGDDNFFVASYKASALPVELTYFKGQTTTEGNLLQWQTATEKNNEGFHIERSTDGNDWQNIGFVNGRGTAYETSNYQFTDARPNKGINYYRLKQMDYDGAFEYSDMVSVEIAVSRKLLAVSPNPVQNGELTLYIPDETFENATLEIFNTVGQLVRTEVLTSNQTNLQLSELPQGMYLFSLNLDGQQHIEKVVVK
jgi:hypothetical protein